MAIAIESLRNVGPDPDAVSVFPTAASAFSTGARARMAVNCSGVDESQPYWSDRLDVLPLGLGCEFDGGL